MGGQALPFIQALALLSTYWPLIVAEAAVLDVAHGAVASGNGQHGAAALSLLCTLLGSAPPQAPVKSLLLVSLVPQLAFGQLSDAKLWTNRALATLMTSKAGAPHPKKGAALDMGCSTPHQAAGELLAESLWPQEAGACGWLHSLEAHLSLGLGREEKACDVNPTTLSLFFALLHHPSSKVQVAAVETLLAAVDAAPGLGITALPVLIQKLSQLVEHFLSGMKAGACSS